MTKTANNSENRGHLLACYDDLQGSCDYGWAMLERGAADRRSAFHTPTVATIGLDGRPRLRTIVLRACDTANRSLRFHTDARSDKINELRANPRAAMHFYDAGAKIQLRLDVRLDMLTGAARDDAWAKTRPMSRECYQVTTAPGCTIDTPEQVVFDAAATDDGAVHFVPVAAHVEAMEWLYLAARGHRRARFDFTANPPAASWLVP